MQLAGAARQGVEGTGARLGRSLVWFDTSCKHIMEIEEVKSVVYKIRLLVPLSVSAPHFFYMLNLMTMRNRNCDC